MMTKDQLLPLNHILSGSIGPLFSMGWEQGIESQRDADWERVKALVEASKEALEHVLELEEAWQRGALGECDGHGGTRSSRNVDVRVALAKALAQLEEQPCI